MSITLVQSNEVNSSGTTTSQAVTLGAGITQGNLAVAAVTFGNNATTITGPSGWTQATINQPAGGSATIETSIWYMVVTGGHAGETSWTWSFGSSHTAYVCIEEWNSSTGWQASPVDKTANGDTSGSPTTATTIVSGTTSTTLQPVELWVASLAYKNSAQSETSITSGWTKDVEATLAANNTATMLYQVVSSTGAAACQYTIGSAQFWAGCVVTFMPQVARTIPTSAVLLTTQARTIPTSAVLASNLRIIPTSAVLKVTSSRTIPTSGVLKTTQARTIPTSAVLQIAPITSGGATLFANGTGTASFDHLRITQYPDPALSCAPVLPRLAGSTASWTPNAPTNTSITVKTSIDGVNFSTATNGSSIPSLNGQPDPVIDIFTADSSANYTNTHKSGGSNATPSYDTTNRRLTLSGGSGGLWLYTAISCSDIDILCVMDESDAGGLVWRFVDSNNYYELGAYDDSSSGGFTNALRLYKVASGTRSLLGSASTISWPRSTANASPIRLIRVTMLSAVITVSIDGTQVQSYTDGSPLGAGQCGLRNDGGTSRYYQFRAQPQGDYVSGNPTGDKVTSDFVYTQVSMSTTDPSAMPQLLDLTTSVRSASIGSGALVPQLHDPSKPFAEYLDKEMDNITALSGDYAWNINKDGAKTFQARTATPSPWCLHSTDLLYDAKVTPSSIADLYRNRQIITNCINVTTLQNETKIGDGSASSWQMAYPLYSAPTIVINNVTRTVGVQGVDTGKDFYWQAGSNAIGQDSSAAKIPAGTAISFAYVGQFPDTVTRNNDTEQTARKAAETGTSGIVENIEDGKGMLVSNAIVYADGLLSRYGNNSAVQLVASTQRAGITSGMMLPVFIAEHKLINRQMLVTQVAVTTQLQADNTALYFYAITATEGANLQNWTKVFKL